MRNKRLKPEESIRYLRIKYTRLNNSLELKVRQSLKENYKKKTNIFIIMFGKIIKEILHE